MVKRGLAVLVVIGGLLSACSSDTSDDAAPGTRSPPTRRRRRTRPRSRGVDPEPGSTPAADPATYDDALAHFDALGSEPYNVRRFVMPSGNIYCAVKVKGIAPGGEISVGAVEDEAVCADSPTDEVGRVQFVSGRATPVCNTDTIRQSNPPVLDYGVAARWKNFKIMCLSESIGVTVHQPQADRGLLPAPRRVRHLQRGLTRGCAGRSAALLAGVVETPAARAPAGLEPSPSGPVCGSSTALIRRVERCRWALVELVSR